MEYQSAAKIPESEYQARAKRWAKAKEDLDTATQQQHATTEAMHAATEFERDAWNELEMAAGRAQPPSSLPAGLNRACPR